MSDEDQLAPRGEACPDCSALVVDLRSHEQWHSRLVADLARAVEKEIKRAMTAAR
jgi:hypothetical protein